MEARRAVPGTTGPRFVFWWRWLVAVSAGIAAFGALLVVAPGLARRMFGLLIYSSPGRLDAFGPDAVAYIALTHAVLGAVMFGWGVALVLVLAGPFRRGSSGAWWTVVVSLLAWFVPDTWYSLASGFWQNAVLNSVFAVLYLPALVATRGSLRPGRDERRADRQEPRVADPFERRRDMRSLGRPGKIAIVIGGYAAALVAATMAEAIRVRMTSGPDTVASSGMYAFGDFVVFVTVFTLVALVPTALALHSLRTHARFWAGLSAVVLAMAITGPLAAAAAAWTRGGTAQGSAWMAAGAFGFLRVLGAPLLVVCFATTAVFAPAGGSRRRLLVACALECLTVAYLVFHFFVSIPR